MKKIFLLLVGVTSLVLTSSAQQEPHFTMFMFNRQNLNPGYTGSNGSPVLEFIGRKQWVDIEGAPQTFAASFSTPIGSGSTMPHSAVGLSFYSDKIGTTVQNNVSLQYAYRAKLNKETVLSFGVQGNFLNLDRNLADLTPHDQGDATLSNSNNESDNLGNIGAGLYLYHEKYYLGVGVPNIIRQEKFDGSGEQIVRHFYGMAGYMFRVSRSMVLRPAVLLKYAGDQDYRGPVGADLNVSAIWNDTFMFGLSYRVNESIDAMMKLRVSENFFVGYAYDFGLQGVADYSNGSHEITLGFNWGGVKTKSVNHPRFVNYF